MNAPALALLMTLAVPGTGIPIPDGFADPELGLVFVIGSDQQITALDLAKGRARWTMKEPGLPLGLQEGQLIVLIQDKILALEAETGNIKLESQPLGLGAWSILGRHHSHGGQTFTHWEVLEKENLLFEWVAANERVTGFAGVIKEGEAGGKISVNLNSGTVSRLSEMPPQKPSNKGEPPFLGSLRASLAAGDNLVYFYGLDGAFVLARRSLARESVDWYKAHKLSFAWDLYEVSTGKKLGSPKIPLLVRAFSVVGTSVLGLWQNEQPGAFAIRELRVLDFRGRQKWSLKLWSPPAYPPVP